MSRRQLGHQHRQRPVCSFKPATWNANGGVGLASPASRFEQIRVAENVLRTQGHMPGPCGPRGATLVFSTLGTKTLLRRPLPDAARPSAAAPCWIFDFRKMCDGDGDRGLQPR